MSEKVAGKTLLISGTLDIEGRKLLRPSTPTTPTAWPTWPPTPPGRKLLRPDDAYNPLREFDATYEGTPAASGIIQRRRTLALRSGHG